MSVDGYVKMRKGEKRPGYGSATAVSGTLTIAASPAPVVYLYDSSGAVVSGYNGISATGYDASAAASVRVWYLLDTASLAVDEYRMVFKFSAAGSDSMTRIYEPAIAIKVEAVP